MTAYYTDPVDGTEATPGTAYIDPYGVVFDAVTGNPVTGAASLVWRLILHVSGG